MLGFTGNTGDAEPTPPHVHFEIHPGGEEKDAIDPHAILLAWQEHRDVPPGAWLTRHGGDTAERPGAWSRSATSSPMTDREHQSHRPRST